MSVEERLAAGLKHYENAEYELASEACREILVQAPRHAQALHLLGIVRLEQSAAEEAVHWIRQAVEQNPDAASYRTDLAAALVQCQQWSAAEEAAGIAVRLDRTQIAAWIYLAMAAEHQGKPNQAIRSLVRATTIDPNDVAAWMQLAALAQRTGDFVLAAGCFDRLAGLEGQNAKHVLQAAAAREQAGDATGAIAGLRKFLQQKPDSGEALLALGNLLWTSGQYGPALSAIERAVELDPDSTATLEIFHERLLKVWDLERSVTACRRALARREDSAEIHALLGISLLTQGRHAEAIASFRRGLDLRPEMRELHSALLGALNYLPSTSGEALYAEHLAWGQRHARMAPRRAPSNTREPERKLRIGYVSADFKSHPVGFFIEPLLANHDRGGWEVICYSSGKADEVTERLKRNSITWRETGVLSDEELAAQVERDRVDILVDLSGHTGANRLMTFASKPAPVQVTYLGYPNTTGVPAIDYRVSDAVADPAGHTDRWHTEQLLRLRRTAWCYRPAPDAPQVTEGPIAASGVVTFGSFNNLSKLTEEWIGVWATILSECENARLVLKAGALADAATHARVTGSFQRHGIERERIDLLGTVIEHREHLEVYARIDVALDTFPYQGTTTTCDALWMGVPVLTMVGEHHRSRVGASLLNAVGLNELVSSSVREYVQCAVSLGKDAARVRGLRTSLREMMRRSPLTDEKDFARAWEEALREAWRRWCSENA